MAGQKKLNQTDWITAGFKALTHGGWQAIKVEAIARTMAVSKGSFYWHFKDVLALKQAMIGHWQEVATQRIIAELESQNMPPQARLRLLMEMATGPQSEPYGGQLLDVAIRDWARYEPFVQSALIAADQQRLDYVTKLLQAMGHDQNWAQQKAAILYSTLIGSEQISAFTPVDPRQVLLATLDLVLAETPPEI